MKNFDGDPPIMFFSPELQEAKISTIQKYHDTYRDNMGITRIWIPECPGLNFVTRYAPVMTDSDVVGVFTIGLEGQDSAPAGIPDIESINLLYDRVAPLVGPHPEGIN